MRSYNPKLSCCVLHSQVGILFSGKKLTHLQRQVCSHILHGIQRETIRLKEEWETLVLSDYEVGQDLFSARVSDSYCFELLSQVLIRFPSYCFPRQLIATAG